MDEGREALMATRGDDSFPPLQRLLRDATDEPAEADAVRARAVQLLQSMDELQIPPGRKQRLFFNLGQGHAPRARHLGWLRPIVIGAFLMGIGGGAIASASLMKWPAWIVRSYRKLVSGAADPTLPAGAAAPARRLEVKAAPVEPAPIEPTAPSAAPRRAQGPQRADVRARRLPVETPLDDAALLVEATRALRVARDPGRARALARRYLERKPSGPLADEALAISIEAALDDHDPDAVALSARYLAQFPHGSFRGLAERTLASPQ
jgi:hypothetical protein